ncbi:MAG: hypothetical protein MZV63_04290 [Marinilabiliales bacterium]|nr:hypothetical protein [Marinilabiliales bacterium]
MTSANVDEVIEKRLLSKTDPAVNSCSKTSWKNEQAKMETLLSFLRGWSPIQGLPVGKRISSASTHLYHTSSVYVQQVRSEALIYLHNAFQGKHASVGERSMLGVFQHVIQHIEDKDVECIRQFRPAV